MSEYIPTNGDQITGSPATLNRYITIILASGAHFQFIDGETIEVLVPGAGQAIVTTLGDTVVEAKEAPAPEAVEPETESPGLLDAPPIEEVVEAVVEVLDTVQEELEPGTTEEAPAPKPATRGRKPKAAPAPEAEIVEGE